MKGVAWQYWNGLSWNAWVVFGMEWFGSHG